MTNTEKKLTKKQKFAMLLEIPAVAENEVLSDFVNHEIELLDKKNATKGDKKPTERQKQNASVADMVVEAMTPNRLYTITELLKEVPGLPEDMTNQRMTHIVKGLVDGGKVTKTVDKRKSLFSLS